MLEQLTYRPGVDPLSDEFIVFEHFVDLTFNADGDGDALVGPISRGTVFLIATYHFCSCEVETMDDTHSACVGDDPFLIDVADNDSTNCGMVDQTTLRIPSATPGFSVMNGEVRFDPTGFPAGSYSATYEIASSEAPSCFTSGTVTVELCETVANDDTRRMCYPGTVGIPVLFNDTTTCGRIDPVTFDFVDPVTELPLPAPPHPGLTFTSPGVSFDSTAMPEVEFLEFFYRVANNEPGTDGEVCYDVGRVTITVCRTRPLDDLNNFVCEDESLSIDVLANDTANCGGIDRDSLMLDPGPGNGWSINPATDQVVFDSAAYVGAYPAQIDYSVANSNMPFCRETATIFVDSCVITADPINATICFGEEYSADRSVTSTCGGPTISLVAPIPPGLTLTGNTIRYDSLLGPPFGTVMGRYRATGDGATPCFKEADIIIEVCARPIALNDTVQVTDASVTELVIDILDNDLPGEGADPFPTMGPCGITIVTPPSNGTVTINDGNALDDCTVTYTPSGASIEADTFCYRITNSKGCYDEACVTIGAECVPINRRECGSLLLFPEWDNREGVVTLVTVTNKNCPPTGNPNVDNISLEYVYIDKDECQEFNRVETLTPCDTLTVLTNEHNPGTGEGFLYVFARRWQNGPPVSFNYLIGQSVVLDGLDAFDYGVNAVAFESPLARNTETDQNGNGLRDLDDMEYRGAPDELLIPRFLGQCTPGMPPVGGGPCIESELVLVNLTGGAAFLATVDFLIYNDNEQQFSAEYTFNCWANPKLLEISNVFSQDFLAASMHDPGEILGATQLESGWFRINGAVADSTAVSLPNPAIYGFLIEKVGDYAVADLPFEYCSQKNGSLYARNVLGTF